MKINRSDHGPMYYFVESDANNFNNEQLVDIYILINYILPYLKKNKGMVYGDIISRNIEFLGAGVFGITIYYGKLLFKIIKVNILDPPGVVNEINKSLQVFFDRDGQYYQGIPAQISRIYGFITSNPYVYRNIIYRPPDTSLPVKCNLMELYTNFGNQFDLDTMYEVFKQIKADDRISIMNGTIVILVMSKEDTNMADFKTVFKSMSVLSHTQ